jgi:hypothetical protein
MNKYWKEIASGKRNSYVVMLKAFTTRSVASCLLTCDGSIHFDRLAKWLAMVMTLYYYPSVSVTNSACIAVWPATTLVLFMLVDSWIY